LRQKALIDKPLAFQSEKSLANAVPVPIGDPECTP